MLPLKKSQGVEGADEVKDAIIEQVWSTDSCKSPAAFLEGMKEKVFHSTETGQTYLRATTHDKMGESVSDNWAAKCWQPKTAATVGVAIRAYN